MKSKPNALQRLIHRFIMLCPVTTFFAYKIHLVDKSILKLTSGKYTISKTGQIRTSPLVGLIDGDKIAIIGSSFGRAHTPGWYYNLKAHPQCNVESRERSREYIAREVSGDEYERYWQLAISYYAGYEKYKERAAHRHIPIMVLEPKK